MGAIFPRLTNVLMVSQQVKQCRAGKMEHASSPLIWTMSLAHKMCRLLPMPVSNKILFFISLQYVTSNTKTSVSSDLTIIFSVSGNGMLIFRQCRTILVERKTILLHDMQTQS